MRFLLTSDWHLGRLFHGVHLTDDQAFVLDRFAELAKDAHPDAILIAGDIFDRAVPPPQAVELLDGVLCRLVLDLSIPVIVIAGNHDSPVRLGFASRLLAEKGLFVFGALQPETGPVILQDEHGRVAIQPLPYAEPPVVRERLGAPEAVDHNSALAARMGSLKKRPDCRSVLLAHAFVSGGEESESERPLSVGGIGTVDARLFEGHHFTAVGHLHRPQSSSGGRIHYPGSLMKYSFSETRDAKSVSLIELDGRGRFSAERVTLTVRRDMRRIEGRMDDLLEGPKSGESRDDYLLVTLLDKGAILDAMGRLREVYPNILHIERPFLLSSGTGAGSGRDHLRRSEAELFEAFFAQVNGEDLSEAEKAAFREVLDAWRASEREA